MKKSRFNHLAALPDGGFGLYNFFTGSFIRMNFLSVDYYENANFYGADYPQVKQLRDAGFLVDYDELAYLQNLVRLSCTGGSQIGLTICPTLACNFDCPYCYEKDQRHNGKMSAQVQDELLACTERMIRLFRPDEMHVSWFGGEPLMALDVISALSERFLALCEKEHIEYSAGMVSNGYLLASDLAQFFEKYRIKSIQITLDGPDAESNDKTRRLIDGGGSFDRIMQNIRAFDADCRISIRCNLGKDNAHLFPALEKDIEQLAQKSGRKIKAYPGHMLPENDYADKALSRAEFAAFDRDHVLDAHDMNFHGCFCGISRANSIVVDDLGQVYKCWHHVGMKDQVVGHVRDYSVLAPQRMNADRLNGWLDAAWPGDDEECMNCPLLPVCVGGCPQQRAEGNRMCESLKYQLDDYVIAIAKKQAESKKDQAQ